MLYSILKATGIRVSSGLALQKVIDVWVSVQELAIERACSAGARVRALPNAMFGLALPSFNFTTRGLLLQPGKGETSL